MCEGTHRAYLRAKIDQPPGPPIPPARSRHAQGRRSPQGWKPDQRRDLGLQPRQGPPAHPGRKRPPGSRIREIQLLDLKGLYFVKDLEGDLGHAKSNIFDLKDLTPGRKIRILFKDGETMHGITQSYQPGRAGFFVVPADRRSNTERAYIVTSAAADITFL